MSPTDVIGFGFTTLDTIGLVPHLPDVDEGILLEDLTRQGGGPVAQALVTLARLGASVGFVGRIGDDEVGAEIRTGLQAEGVDTSYLQIEPGARSPQSMILVDKPTGKRSICAFRGTASHVDVSNEMLEYLCSGRFLHLDGHSPAAALAAAEAASNRGVRICLDAGAGASIDQLRPLVQATTVLIAAERFAMSVAPDGSCATGAARLLQMGPESVVVTRGEQGSYTLTRETGFSTAACPVAVVDTTGAGDVFHGAYLYGQLQNWNLVSTAEFAGAAAALKCTRLGGRAAIPRLPEVLNLMAKQGRRLPMSRHDPGQFVDSTTGNG